MKTTATCAACGEQKELCGSCRIDGVQQPRICKECLLHEMNTGDCEINNVMWMKQIIELGDMESLAALDKQTANAQLDRQEEAGK